MFCCGVISMFLLSLWVPNFFNTLDWSESPDREQVTDVNFLNLTIHQSWPMIQAQMLGSLGSLPWCWWLSRWPKSNRYFIVVVNQAHRFYSWVVFPRQNLVWTIIARASIPGISAPLWVFLSFVRSFLLAFSWMGVMAMMTMMMMT